MPGIPKGRLVPVLGGSALAMALLVGGGLWWTERQHFESTDNAFVAADTVSVSPQVSGYVAEVLVADNQRVIPGQVLVRLDPATFQARLDQAAANADSLQAAVRGVDDRSSSSRPWSPRRPPGSPAPRPRRR